MIKKILTAFFVMVVAGVYAQDFYPCYTHEAMLKNDEDHPGYIDRVNEIFERAKLVGGGQDREEVYTIPVVVHIVYNTPEENLHDSVVFNQIESLNADYRRLNEDAENVRDVFDPIVGDTYIGFELASIDPDGNPTTGITRTETTVTSFFDFGTFTAEGVKSSLEGGIDPWDQDRYLNIWVCDMSVAGTPFILGYATPPDGLPHWPDGTVDGLDDGVVIQYQSFGANNPNPLEFGGDALEVRGRTATHEVGHYLGLRHIWGDGDCTAEDGVDDTPNANAQSEFDCDTTKNTCVDDIADLGDLPDMVENFMDYSAETCQNSFTQGQVDIMRGVLEVDRFDLVNANPALSITEDETVHFGLYPNPSNGTAILVFDEQITAVGQLQVEILSETGQLVEQRNILTTQSFEISGLTKGFYWVRVISSEGIKSKKLVVI